MAHLVTFCSKGSRLTPNRSFRNSSSFSEGPRTQIFLHRNRPILAHSEILYAQKRENADKEGCTEALGRFAPLLTHRLLEGSVKTSGRFLQNGRPTLFLYHEFANV